MRKNTFPIAAMSVLAAVTLAACSSSDSDSDSPETFDTPGVAQVPVREVVPAQLGETITVDAGQGPLVTFTITDISRTDSCDYGTSISTPEKGQFLAVDYELEVGQAPSASGLVFTTLDEEGFSQETGPDSLCNEGSSINQFRAAEKLRGTYYFDVSPDAAKLKAEPRFGPVDTKNLPAGWAWEIPS